MTPEQRIEIERIVDAALTKRLGVLIGGATPTSQYIDDSEVCELLRCSDRQLRKLISDGELVQGAHFTGSNRSRLWIRERVERYIETRGLTEVQNKDVKRWLRG